MKIDAKHPIALNIDQTANGYIVTEVVGRDEVTLFCDAHVFPSQAALFEYLARHFTHRCTSVAMDPAPPGVLLGDEKAGRDVGYASGLGFTEFGRRE